MTNWWRERLLTPYSCTACQLIVEKKSPMRSWTRNDQSSSIKPRAGCTCRKPSCIYCLEGKPGCQRGELMSEKIVLAYSGGLDTSIIIPWLKENYAYDVIAMVG